MKIDYSDLSECTFQTLEANNLASSTATPSYSLASTVMQQTAFALPPIYCIRIDSVDRGNGKYCFVQPIIAIVGYNDNLYSMENKDLDIVTSSSEYDNCLQDFKDEVLFILKEYSEENDNKLTSDAQELKRRILRYLKR
jgi:hypothetical protein